MRPISRINTRGLRACADRLPPLSLFQFTRSCCFPVPYTFAASLFLPHMRAFVRLLGFPGPRSTFSHTVPSPPRLPPALLQNSNLPTASPTAAAVCVRAPGARLGARARAPPRGGGEEKGRGQPCRGGGLQNPAAEKTPKQPPSQVIMAIKGEEHGPAPPRKKRNRGGRRPGAFHPPARRARKAPWNNPPGLAYSPRIWGKAKEEGRAYCARDLVCGRACAE